MGEALEGTYRNMFGQEDITDSDLKRTVGQGGDIMEKLGQRFDELFMEWKKREK